MKRAQIPIPVPCEVRLEDMQSRGLGRRYCGQCRKTVHFLSAMTERRAKAFLERAAGDDDVCVSYAVGVSGDLLFAPEPRSRFVRLPVAVGVAAAVAACSPSKSEQSKPHDAVVLASASAASGSECKTEAERQQSLERSLHEAKDDETRAKLKDELENLRLEINSREKEHMVVAGKMQMPSPPGRNRKVKNGPCNCAPDDPLCSCL